MQKFLILSALALPMALAACVTEGSGPATPVENACGATALQWMVGRPAAEAGRINHPGTVRVIQPGMAVTMDYRADRLNIEISEAGTIARVFCG